MIKKILFLILLIAFTSVITFSQDLKPKEEKGKWGFVNGQDEWIVKPQYSTVTPFSHNLSCVSKKGKWGYLNKEGKIIIPLQFSEAKPFVNELAAVRSLAVLTGNTRENNNKYKWGFIDTEGKLVVDYLFRNVNDFDKEGRSLVGLFKMKSNENFWINKQGEAISPPFIKKEKRNNTYFLTNERKDGKKVYRYIKPSGESITKWYLNDFNLNDSLIKVWLPTKTDNDTLQELAYGGNPRKKVCAFINSNGEVLTDWYSEIKAYRKGFAPVRKNYLYGFINENFEVVTKPKYREISYLKNDTYKAQIIYGKSVLLTIKGEEKSLYNFDFEDYSDDLFLGVHQLKSKGKKELKYAIFNTQGKQKSSWYTKIHPIRNKIARVEDIRPIYTKGKEVRFKNHYNYVKLSSGELITNWRVSNQTKWEGTRQKSDSILTYLYLSTPILNLDKSFFETIFIKEFKLDKKQHSILFSGGDFHNGMALVTKQIREIEQTKFGTQITKDKVLYGYIDWYGDLVVPYKYAEASAFRNGYAVVGNESNYGVINRYGSLVLPYSKKIIGGYGTGVLPFLNEDAKWGFISLKGREQIAPIYDEVTLFSYGYASVKKGRYWALINAMGEEILPFEYRKPIEVISTNKIKVLENGIGYVEKNISDL